jgi:hypothetical protein
MELDRIPLWRGDSVAVKQLAEDFARYLYLPRLADSSVLVNAVRDGVALLTWPQDSFAYAESYDEAAGRYRGLCSGRNLNIADHNAPGLVVKPEVALKQLDSEVAVPTNKGSSGQPGEERGGPREGGETVVDGKTTPPAVPKPRRYHGTVSLDPTRVGRDAGRIADEVIAHLAGLVGSTVTVTLEIDAEIPAGAPDQVVRIVTENGRTLKFVNQGFETD